MLNLSNQIVYFIEFNENYCDVKHNIDFIKTLYNNHYSVYLRK